MALTRCQPQPKAAPPPKTPRVTLPYHSYPTLISLIFDLGDIYTWSALRGVCRGFRARADARIFTHLGVFKDERTGIVSVSVPVAGAQFFPRTRADLEHTRILTLIGPLLPRDIRRLRALNLHTVRIYHEDGLLVDCAPFNNFPTTALVVTCITGPPFRPLEPPQGVRRLVVNFKYDARPVLPEDVVEVPYTTRELVFLFTDVSKDSRTTTGALARLAELVQFSCLLSDNLDTLTLVGFHEIDRQWLGLDPALDRDAAEALFLALVASRMRARWLGPDEDPDADLEDVEDVEEQIREVVACVRFLSGEEYRAECGEEWGLVTEL